MRRLKFVFILFFLVFLYSCNTKSLDKTIIDSLIDTIPYELNKDLEIPTTYEYNNNQYTVSYSSNNPDLITNDGKITRAFTDKSASINLKITDGKNELEEEVSFVILKLNEAEVRDLIINHFGLNETITKDLNLTNSFIILDQSATLVWTSENEQVLANSGKVNFKTETQQVNLNLELTYENINYEYTFNLNVKEVSGEEYINLVVENFEIPEEVKASIELPYNLSGVGVLWYSSHPDVLTKDGEYKYPTEDTLVELKATFLYSGIEIEKTYNVLVKAMTNQDKFELAIKDINLPEVLTTNLVLPTKFQFGIVASWKSTNPDILTDDGFITLTQNVQEVSLILTLSLGEDIMEKEFKFKTETINANEVYVNNHIFVDYATNFKNTNFNNLTLEGDRAVLTTGKTEGSYESPIFKANNFKTLVGSWAAISNTKTTAELQVRVRVDGVWSKYFSYGSFGLGLENKMFDQSDTVAKLDDDIIFINNNKTADAFQYKVILKRDTPSDESAKLSLVAITLEIPDYVYNVDISNLPSKVEYDLPNLYQIDVPGIGNSICSPTSAAMMLMYHGHEFSDKELPHRESAKLLREYNSGIYGNWVFNTVGMSAFGENTYVQRIYSFEELLHHLATVGPVALSIKGDTGRYYTNGHLLVVSGYEITPSGRNILVHDPNLPEVEYKYSESIFNRITRNVIYVMEAKK